MTGLDKGALDALRSRIDHVAATARLLAQLTDMDADMQDALAGIGQTLGSIALQIDTVLHRAGEA
jgi:hypothetical protein